MTPLPDEAILQTLVYADIFDYPLTPGEVHHFLIGVCASPDSVQAALESSPWLLAHTVCTNGYVMLRGRQAIGDLRNERGRASAALWPRARRWARVLGCLPFVRMVAVTGALALDNAPAGDDVDYLIVTAPGRVWLARGLAVLVVRAARWTGVGLCPNYVLAETALAQARRDLYVAHDLAQMVPLVGQAVYVAMRLANDWSYSFLPNAHGPWRQEADLTPRGWLGGLKRLGERLLGGRLGDRLEAWERRRKLARFAASARRPTAAAELDADRIKGHFDDHGSPILRRYEEGVRRFSLPTGLPVALRVPEDEWAA